MSDCRGPEFCIDDLCVNSDQGLCGKWRLDPHDDWGQEYDDETMVDLGGGMVVPLRELMEDDDA